MQVLAHRLLFSRASPSEPKPSFAAVLCQSNMYDQGLPLAYTHLCYASGILLVLYLLRIRFIRLSGYPLPPGPAKLPVVGNLFNMPSSFEWEVFHRWSKQYNSDIIHVSVPGTSLIILDSLKATTDLLDKRSSIYSSRPKFTVISKVMGFSWLLPFMPYGPSWKERRRLLSRYFHPSNDKLHKPVEIEYARKLLLLLLEDPEHYLQHLNHAVGGCLLSMTYGDSARQPGQHHLRLAEEVGRCLSDGVVPGTMLLDVIPSLARILSPVLVGPRFKKSEQEWEALVSRFRDVPFRDAENSRMEGSASPSFVSAALDQLPVSENNEQQHKIIKDVAGIIFLGGSGTMGSALHTFFLAMTLFPGSQAKAQEELDRVVGQARLPNFDDEPSLPYLSALIKEVIRWRAVGPLGLPHVLEKDDVYNGYFIPAQSVVLSNMWAILHNDNDYPDPETFQPERFLKDGCLDTSVRDPADVIFGFGRRVCPGEHIARSTMYIIIASVLSTFNIATPVDEKGVRIEPGGEYQSGITFQPLPFKCAITPRHDKAEALIRGVDA
ncbi:unnamed protein product [Cyclocybe aegerita]|uniref:Cytochrome P450 n=1 Tax=Cyclocybe aegerita TaxID=1973307 RepID=A0A8S0XQQ9_CYCAE|nr:unnamed protein product [Cyclocybe aegerita]